MKAAAMPAQRPSIKEGSVSDTAKKKIIQALCTILLFSVMNATMFNIALPAIATQYQLLPSQVGWVVTGYIIIYALGSLTYGKLSDIYPMKKLLTIGLILFAVGSLIGALSTTYWMVLAARLIQSAGASSIPALAMLIPTRYFPVSERGKVLGIIASMIAFASGVGPIVAGFITGTLHWKFLFLISLGALLTLPIFRKYLPDDQQSGKKLDVVGGLLFGGSIACVLVSITNFHWLVLLAGILLFVLFLFRQNQVSNPFIQAEIFSIRTYRNTLIVSFITGMAAFGTMIMLPLMLTHVNLLSPNWIGLVLFPGAMSAAIMGRVGGKLVDKIGGVRVARISLLLLVAGTFLLSTFSGYAAFVIALCLMVVSVGQSFGQSSLATLVSTSLPKELTGVGMGIYSMINFMSGAFSGAMITKILDFPVSELALNPLGLHGPGVVYSNVFLGLFLLVLINLLFFTSSTRKLVARK
ncbi:MFS transporter [Brevibacillus sp. SYSU BS000544]|uniref:MFS transporter n=1 Tax=Brevibacillus sp. SYSU BS000544 TaxID=3416443 RepID=UPI003CE4E720